MWIVANHQKYIYSGCRFLFVLYLVRTYLDCLCGYPILFIVLSRLFMVWLVISNLIVRQFSIIYVTFKC